MNKKAYTYYCLDILHIGHINYIKKCRQILGSDGILIAGILLDSAVKEKKSEPILSFEERFEVASSIKYFDKVVAQESYSPLTNLKKIKPNILFESSSHEEKDIIILSDFMKKINGKVIKIPYFNNQSSTNIKDMIKARESYEK